MRDAGVDLSYCAAHPTLPTGVAMICVATSGENHIVVAPGANASLVPERLPPAAADALICQLEVPASTILAAAAHFSGMVCINLAPARDVSDELLAVADLLIVNQTESDWYGERLALGRGLVATTYGAAGARLTDHGRLIAETRAPVVEVVDTTGAGDAFTAALTVALVEGMSPQRALEFACAAGSIAATGRGAQPSMPDRATLADALPTTSARCAGDYLLTPPCYGKGSNSLTPGCNHGRDRTGFSTTTLWIGGILDIAADMYVAIVIKQCGAYLEARIAAVGVLARGECPGGQLLISGAVSHWRSAA